MVKPRILMVNEASILNTGYSVYGREVLSRLFNTGKYEIAELATYVDRFDPRLNNIPWKVYPNLPDHQKNEEHHSQEKNDYNSKTTNVFGEYIFDAVCRDFKPHIVFAIRDYWMDEFLSRSPYRNRYNLNLLAPVDSIPQNEQWIALYGDADGVFTYTDWGVDRLNEHTKKQINIIGAAPPVASEDYFPLAVQDIDQLKKDFGFPNYKIIGTVNRNQSRKLFPELFNAFRKYLDVSKSKNTLLYCHTSYPDPCGWDLPKLLLEHGLSSKVLFTYVCLHCNTFQPSFYHGPNKSCHACGQNSIICNVERGIDNKSLNLIYNIMDLFVQPANFEGFGMAQCEAAACGVPVISTDYSAMTDVVRKLNGYPLPVKHLSLEITSGAYKAVPDIDYLADFFVKFMAMDGYDIAKAKKLSRLGFEQNYGSWDKTVSKWSNYFDSVDISKYEQRWSEPKEFRNPVQLDKNVQMMTNGEYIEWALRYVLCDPSKIGSYMHARLLRDLNNGFAYVGISGLYYNEMATEEFGKPKLVEFNRETIYYHFLDLVHRYNQAEAAR